MYLSINSVSVLSQTDEGDDFKQIVPVADPKIDSLGNYVIAGKHESNGYIGKYSSSGRLLFGLVFGGNSTDTIVATHIDSEDNIIGFVGKVRLYDEDIFVDTRNGNGYDAIIVKMEKYITKLSYKI